MAIVNVVADERMLGELVTLLILDDRIGREDEHGAGQVGVAVDGDAPAQEQLSSLELLPFAGSPASSVL